MEKLIGTAIAEGYALGNIYYIQKDIQKRESAFISDSAAELVRFEHARMAAIDELEKLYFELKEQIGKTESMVFIAQKLILEDPEVLEPIRYQILDQMRNAEFAVSNTIEQFVLKFQAMKDPLFQSRALDIKDVGERLEYCLANRGLQSKDFIEPVVLAADEMTPGDLMTFQSKMVKGVLTRTGAADSHLAILARNRGLPVIILPVSFIEWKNRVVLLNGYSGEVCLEPDSTIRKEAEKKMQQEIEQKVLLHDMKGKETITNDGKRIGLLANINGISDIPMVLQNDAEGIGLFRSEFLFIEKDHMPSEEEQFLAYKKAAKAMKGKLTIIRTVDLGYDKTAGYLPVLQEENPALGLRGVRFCLKNTSLFKTQLRAIIRAGAYGRAAILIPMITSVSEVKEVKRLIEESFHELVLQGNKVERMELGIMIETPAAALISSELAKEVDFFSIGTNDLTQYTLAADRQNGTLNGCYYSKHPAVLRLVEITVKNAHKQGIRVGICGELASDLTLTEWFLELGIDDLSVPPAYILRLRKKIREYISSV